MRNSQAIDNSQDVIDSRDVIERIETLESAMADAQETADGEKETMEDGESVYTSVDFGEDEYRELKALKSLADEASGYAADWTHGEALIRDSYFVEYAQQLAEDCGMLEHCDKWPATCIDWDKAADELKVDYTSVDFDSETYWIR